MQNSIVTRGYRFMMMRSADHFGEILSCGFVDLRLEEGQRKLCLLLARQHFRSMEVVTENARIVATTIVGMEPEYRVVTPCASHIDA